MQTARVPFNYVVIHLRMIVVGARLKPTPNRLLPAPARCDGDGCGSKPENPGLVMFGAIIIKPALVIGFSANFTPVSLTPPTADRNVVGTRVSLPERYLAQQ